MWKSAIGAVSHMNFKIRKNLHDGLLRLRSKYTDVYLWVDAICIDQSKAGEAEKARQLAIMSRIYNSASNICVWLGEGYDGAEIAFGLVHDIMNYCNFDEMVLNPEKQEAWRILISIMKAPWFSRRWVIQEIALSRDASVHCGGQSIHWDDFADAVSLLMEKIELIRNTYKDQVFDDVEKTSACILVQTLCNVCRKEDQGKDQGRLVSGLLDVETLVSTLLSFQAAFPRDTIYSILSLAKDYPQVVEDWQDLHREQLDVLRRRKEQFIDVELKSARVKKESLEEAREIQKPLESEVRRQKSLIEQKKKEKQEARISGAREQERGIDQDLRQMKIPEVDYADDALHTLENAILQVDMKIKQLEALLDRTNLDFQTRHIGLLPNYKFSPRDLFIAFVTRSIHQSGSLDIICRHWAPSLTDDEGGDTLPSWISSLSLSPFGISRSVQGRQNGENFVAYLPHDQRRQYSASDATRATIEMALDPMLDFQDGGTTLEINVLDTPLLPITEYKLSIANHRLGLTKANPATLLSAQPASEARKSQALVDEEPGVSDLGVHPRPTRNLTPSNSRSVSGNTADADSGANGQTSGAQPRRLSVSQRTISWTQQTKDRTLKGNSKGNWTILGSLSSNQRIEQTTHWIRKPQKIPNSPEKKQQHCLSGVLRVQGFILGEVVAQSEVMRGGIVPGEWVAMLGWGKDINNENRVPDTLWRLLVADRMERGGKPPQWYKRACLHGLVDDRVSDSQGNIHPVIHNNRSISELTSKYFKRVESVVWNRRMFALKLDKKLYTLPAPEHNLGDENEDELGKAPMNGVSGGKVTPNNASHEVLTDENRTIEEEPGENGPEAEDEPPIVMDSYEPEPPEPKYGLAPQGCKVSDIVCILHGCSVPVVLSRSREQRYKVVGEAYVHGMMEGEAMELAEDFRVSPMTFDLI